jgi:aminoglycoside phosphotransferase (APT) family kinase protein
MLARLAPTLPVAIPEVLGLGRPAPDYPSTWGVLRWIDGDVPVEDDLAAPDLLAADLAGFLRAFWKIDIPGGTPACQGGPLSTLHQFTLRAIEDVRGLIEADAALDIWTQAIQLRARNGPDCWIHADLMPGNLITRNNRLAAVIDFDFTGIGDPSRDLIVAWMLLPSAARPAFKSAVNVDDATWLRGRARALSEAIGHLRYYKDLNAAMNSTGSA